MYDSDLLERIQRNDAEAYLEMTEHYGWALYTAIREKYPDPAVADKVYNEVMNAFYHSLSDSNTKDPVEALLLGFAQRITPDNLVYDQEATETIWINGKIQFSPQKYASWKPEVSENNPSKLFNFLGIILIFVILTGCFWIIAGFLMKMEMIPFFDLGYSWLDSLIVIFLPD